MSLPLPRAARGAVAGAVAAAVWSLQERLDQRMFGVPYSDSALLGRWVTSGPAWPAVGFVLHMANGAAFGAAYATVAPRLPLRGGARRGMAAGLAEHLATWPLVGLLDRHHPAHDEMPHLAGDPRAFAQATWRHLLFGAVLGAVEERLNGDPADYGDPLATYMVSSNGHGDIQHATTGAA